MSRSFSIKTCFFLIIFFARTTRENNIATISCLCNSNCCDSLCWNSLRCNSHYCNSLCSNNFHRCNTCRYNSGYPYDSLCCDLCGYNFLCCNSHSYNSPTTFIPFFLFPWLLLHLQRPIHFADSILIPLTAILHVVLPQSYQFPFSHSVDCNSTVAFLRSTKLTNSIFPNLSLFSLPRLLSL